MPTNLSDVSLVIGLDKLRMEELRLTWPTWIKFKPELCEMPLILFYDPDQVDLEDAAFLEEHPQRRYVPWTWWLGQNQVEKMDAGFVHIPASEVKTPWYLKIDTNVVATGPGAWVKSDWFNPDPNGSLPVFVAPPCSFSKPCYLMNLFDEWADKVPQLARFPRLDLPYSSTDQRLTHPTIASWLFFGQTDWTRRIAKCLGRSGRLPYASHASFLFYCAKRTRKHFVCEPMKKLRWRQAGVLGVRDLISRLGIEPTEAVVNNETRILGPANK